ncbi:DedA family protein [Glycomyces sp. NPDC047369]
MNLYLAQAVQEPATGLAGWSVDLIDALGGAGIAIISALDAMVSIVPADIIMPLVGVSASQGAISLPVAIACATAGSLVGALVMYAFGAILGRDRTRALLFKIPGFNAPVVDRAEAWFARHGAKAVLFGRLLPGLRALISLPAGIERMPLLKFTVLTALGSMMWNSTLLVAGYLLGANWHLVGDITSTLTYVLAGLVVIAVVYFVVKRRRARTPAAQDDAEETALAHTDATP